MWITAVYQQWKTTIRIVGYRCEPAFGVRTWQTTHNTLSVYYKHPESYFMSTNTVLFREKKKNNWTHVFSCQIVWFLINHCSNLFSQLMLACSHRHQSHTILIIIIFNFIHNLSYYVIFLTCDALCFYRLQKIQIWGCFQVMVDPRLFKLFLILRVVHSNFEIYIGLCTTGSSW